ncbi:MAG: aminotransferase [Rhodothermaceae bacterium]|nr:MAG: aminotransferase [Rhodothermaceae bacterium]
MKPLAARTENLEQSFIRAVSKMIEATGGINLGQGICDLPTPEPIRRGAREAIEAGASTYSHFAGIEPLRAAILEKVRSYNRLPATSVDEVVVSVGSTGAYMTAILALLNPGDEVILIEPFYGYHRGLLRLIDAVPVYVTMHAPDWTLDFDTLERAITPRTKAVVVNTPANPSGKVWTQQELERLLAVLRQYDLFAITDEIYEYMLYDGREHVSLAALPGAYERTITLSGFSKTYNMTGWRLGYAVAPAPLAARMGLLGDLLYICAPTPLQHGVAEAFSMRATYFAEMQAAYETRRRLLCETLEAIGFDVPWPQGAYYVLAGFAPLARTRPGFADDLQACETLIREAGIGTVPGRAFFANPEDGRYYLRFCFAKELPVLEEACRRLRDAFG